MVGVEGSNSLTRQPGGLPAVPRPGGLLAATNDREAVAAWLAQYRGRSNTLASYTREVERFWWWLRRENLTFTGIRHEDLLRYMDFMADPPPEYVSATSHRKSDPAWRPFRGHLSAASCRQAESILHGLFAWLVEAGYLQANPFMLLRHARGGKRRLTRFLTARQWEAVCAITDVDPVGTREQQARTARDRWMVKLIYYAALRISEAAACTMGDIQPRSVAGETKWALTVVGKGDKERTLPLSPVLLRELELYRTAMVAVGAPIEGGAFPLIASIRGGRPMTRFGLYAAIKDVFDRAADTIDGAEADALHAASPHWLRHTRASSLVNAHVSLNGVRELLGHASLNTTSLYAHEELDRLQGEVERADA